jgi:hypothetical protein
MNRFPPLQVSSGKQAAFLSRGQHWGGEDQVDNPQSSIATELSGHYQGLGL